MKTGKTTIQILVAATVVALTVPFASNLWRDAIAADHADAPALAHDSGADLADTYLFVDPNDTNRLIMALTVHGFIASGENVNFGFFDPHVLFRFELETTGDAKPDQLVDVRFGPRTSPSVGQTATVTGLPAKRSSFTAVATAPTLATAPPAPVLTTNGDGVIFFAGLVDDPFFFDIPAFSRFVSSVRAGTPNPAVFDRGRDSFAGYNVLAVALSIPKELITLRAPNQSLGLSVRTLRQTETQTTTGEPKGSGPFRTVDSEGNPAVNVALVPFEKKNAYNVAAQDKRSGFIPDILNTLNLFGTSTANVGILADVAVARGDYLHLDPNLPGGFPNGRRLADDIIDILLFVISNGGLTAGDHVNANDVPFPTAFPFFAPAQQPREPAAGAEDNTRN